jgi:tetratricopeptide (TPR) repeat protein
MSTSAPLDPQNSANNPADQTPPAPGFEETLRKFWEKNSKAVYLACATVFLVVIAKGGLEYFRAQKENDIAASYASASNSDRLKTFASSHPDHPLGAVANLRLADEAYTAGKYVEAVSSYQKAATGFKTGPLKARAALGVGISKILAGQTSEGESALKQLVDDSSLPAITRAEAAYHLATQAMDAGRSEEAIKLLDKINTLDPTGVWARRSVLHRSLLSATPAPF